MNNNAWCDIKTDEYEAHMAHPLVGQMQLLNGIIKEQLALIPAQKRPDNCVAILGVTNGNGLEHIDPLGIGRVIGIDINKDFLDECAENYSQLNERLSLYRMDLMSETDRAINLLDECELIIANLLVEHIHLVNFERLVAGLHKRERIISCVIQFNPDGSTVSSSGFEHFFKGIVKQAEEEDENALNSSMKSCGYTQTQRKVYTLPNAKQFIRLDYLG